MANLMEHSERGTLTRRQLINLALQIIHVWPLCVQKYTYNDHSRQNDTRDNIRQGVLTRKRLERVPESSFRGAIESLSFARSAEGAEIIRSYGRNCGTVIRETIFPARGEASDGHTMAGSAIQFSAEAPIVRS